MVCPDGGIGSEVHTESIEMLFVGFSRTQSPSLTSRRMVCPDGGIGRHTGLKILRSSDRASSSLALGTNLARGAKLVRASLSLWGRSG